MLAETASLSADCSGGAVALVVEAANSCILRGSGIAQCQSDAGTNSGGFCRLDAAASKKITAARRLD